MKKLFFILTILSFSAFFVASAVAENICAGEKVQPTVKMKTSYGHLHYDFDTSRQGIIRLAHQVGTSEHEDIAGLAIVSIVQNYVIVFIQKIMPDGSICSIPAHVDIFLGYRNPKIYIADDLKMGSCEYNMVLRHEQAHQQINISALNYFLPRLKKGAEKIAASLTPLPAKSMKSVEQVNARLSKEFGKKFDRLINVFKKELRLEQSKLDNVHNYRMEGTICKDYEEKNKTVFRRKK